MTKCSKKLINITPLYTKGSEMEEFKMYPCSHFQMKNVNNTTISFVLIIIFHMKFWFSVEMYWPSLKYSEFKTQLLVLTKTMV